MSTEEMQSSSGEDSSSDDSSSEGEEEEEEKEEQRDLSATIRQLEHEVQANPYVYERHLELIKILRVSGDLDALRKGREEMAAIFPLTEEMWLEWVADEMPLAHIPEQQQYIKSRFELAVQDYASVKIWCEYCQFLMNNISSPADIDKVRAVFESAITAVGLHASEGASIWAGYHEFEINILDSYKQLEDSGDTAGMSEKIEAQVLKVEELFRRQLSIPLIGMQETMRTYEDWSGRTPSEAIRGAFDRAAKKLSLCMEHEEKILTSEDTKLDDYVSYIDFEMKSCDVVRVQCLFERAIKDFALHTELWVKYTHYLAHTVKIHSITLPVYKRALRNCPWHPPLWLTYLSALERSGAEYQHVKEAFSAALKAGLEDGDSYLRLWRLYCDFHRRRIEDWSADVQKVDEMRKMYSSATKYMTRHFPEDDGDIREELTRDLAFIEVKYLADEKRALLLWEAVMKRQSRDVEMWLRYVQFLERFTNSLTVRKTFQRAIQMTMDSSEKLCEAYLSYERMNGTLADVDIAEQKIAQHDVRVKIRTDKAAMEDNDPAHGNLKRKGPAKGQRNVENNKEGGKMAGRKNNDGPAYKKSKPNEKRNSGRDTGNGKTKTNLFKHPALPVHVKGGANGMPKKKDILPATTAIKEEEEEDSAMKTSGLPTEADCVMQEPRDLTGGVGEIDLKDEKEKHDEAATIKEEAADATEENKLPKVDNEKSVFLSNLLFTTTEADLQSFFEKHGAIDTIRIVYNGAGKSKGYAYLQFTDVASVAVALECDRQWLCGRPVFVSACVDKKLEPTQFKFDTTLDTKTLYVSNIPFELSKEDVEKHFSQIGSVKEGRLVTNRSGKSKGFAYIEYVERSDAAAAVLKFDQQMFGGRTLNVAYSNPPAREIPVDGQKPVQPLHPARQNQTGKKPPPAARQQKSEKRPGLVEGGLLRGRSKTQVALLPRALQPPVVPSATMATPAATATTVSEEEETPMEQESKPTATPMSNDDFRRFLMK